MPGRRRDMSAATVSDRPAKKAKLKDSKVNTSQPIVEVLLEFGEKTQSFNIHVELLRSSSSWFRERLDSLEEPKRLVLKDVSPETFGTFSHWIYTKDLVVDELEDVDCDDTDGGDSENGPDDDCSDADGGHDNRPARQRDESRISADHDEDNLEHPYGYSSLNRKGRVFIRLVNLYIFATDYQASSFKNTVMIQWQRFTANEETLPCPTVVKHALSRARIESGLCQYLITCYAYYTDHEKISKARFATLSPEFLTEVLVLAFHRLDPLDDQETVKVEENWCKYHEHEGEEERKDCEKRREDDPDVVAKQWAARRPRPRRWGGCC